MTRGNCILHVLDVVRTTRMYVYGVRMLVTGLVKRVINFTIVELRVRIFKELQRKDFLFPHDLIVESLTKESVWPVRKVVISVVIWDMSKEIVRFLQG